VQPKVLSLSEVLSQFIAHRKEVIVRRTKYELQKAKERYHILEGLHKCLSKIDEVIKIIKASLNREDALKNLIKRFKLSEIQANAILDTKLSFLARLERKKIEDELKEIEKQMKELMAILKSPKKVEDIFKKETLEVKEKFGDERKTKFSVQGAEEIAEEDLIPHEETIITLTKGGYIKRINPNTYKIQKRGGKGILGMKTMQEDIVEHFLLADTHDSLLFFTDSGKVFRTMVYDIAEGTRVARGRGLLNFIDITPNDKILSIMALSKEETKSGVKNLLMVTENGIIKRTELEQFKNVRKTGLIAIKLKKGDLLKNVFKTTGEDEVVLITRKGLSIKFKEKDIREMGRSASGVKAMGLKKEDKIVGGCAIRPEKEKEEYLLVLTEKGFGKKTNVKEYRLQKRGGSGIKAANINPKTGDLVFAQILYGDEEDLIIISRKGHIIRTGISSIPKLGRATQGVRIMKLEPGNGAASAICV
ncbi:MAG: DNA gyrase C-terminal beta-propeller domain-containing protein, partial [Candidatus Pacebacteria bacterium]|nr:DNA gyrase C-terminal beta-propeller domain-containing protein [Candidatus Paceibacterota bacterium]